MDCSSAPPSPGSHGCCQTSARCATLALHRGRRVTGIRLIATSTLATSYDRFTSILLKNPLFWCQHLGFLAMSARQIPGSPPHVAKMGAGSGMSFASFRRFWAVAANRNSSLAPFGPQGPIDRA